MTHIGVSKPTTLVQIMACRLVGAKPLSEPIVGILFIEALGTKLSETLMVIHTYSFKKISLKMCKMAIILSRPRVKQ